MFISPAPSEPEKFSVGRNRFPAEQNSLTSMNKHYRIRQQDIGRWIRNESNADGTLVRRADL